MSHQDGWKISLEHLANDGPDGITAVRTAIHQLQDLGYLQRNQIRNEKNHIEGSEWILSDPFEKPEPQLENLMLGNLEENLMLGNLTLKNTTNLETNRKQILEDFEMFWVAYPRKIGKGAAVKAFEKAVKKVSAEVILAALQSWTQKPLPEMQYIPHPATWLNQERWEDDLNATSTSKSSSSIAADIMNRANAMQGFVRGELE
jgi:hypothetical protein